MRNPLGKPGSGPPSSVSPSFADQKRRRFLFALGAGGAGVAAGTVAALPAVAAVGTAAEAPVPQASGYQETEHVRTYYRTARI